MTTPRRLSAVHAPKTGVGTCLEMICGNLRGIYHYIESGAPPKSKHN